LTGNGVSARVARVASCQVFGRLAFQALKSHKSGRLALFLTSPLLIGTQFLWLISANPNGSIAGDPDLTDPHAARRDKLAELVRRRYRSLGQRFCIDAFLVRQCVNGSLNSSLHERGTGTWSCQTCESDERRLSSVGKTDNGPGGRKSGPNVSWFADGSCWLVDRELIFRQPARLFRAISKSFNCKNQVGEEKLLNSRNCSTLGDLMGSRGDVGRTNTGELDRVR